MQLMANGVGDKTPVVAGESAIAGLAGLIGAVQDSKLARQMNLNKSSRVLLFGTEGATDPALYRELTGTSAENVIA
jgi:diaminopropionate ammonia-lyase